MMLLEWLLICLEWALLVPVTVLSAQVLLASLPPRQIPNGEGKRPSIAVLVPAHNEANGISATLATILPQLGERDRLLVVADNCNDATARVATAADAEVVERYDDLRRGKGYALDFGVRHLEKHPPEVVVIIDADCQADAGLIDRVSRLCQAAERPVQALYLMRAPAGAGLGTRIAEFAWLVKNLVRPLGFARLGLPCQLMGSGMAFPWKVIRAVNLASGELVEDLKLGLELARARKPALFCRDVRVTSEFPSANDGLAGQRKRWEHGHLGMMIKCGPLLFIDALKTGNIPLLALVFDLSVPPLALLALLCLFMSVITGGWWVSSGMALPFTLAGATMLAMGFAIVIAWASFGRRVISLASLAYAPVYAVLKIPLYLKFLRKRQVEWVRSSRDGE